MAQHLLFWGWLANTVILAVVAIMLSRLSLNVWFLRTNHLPHIEAELKGLAQEIRTALANREAK